MHKMTTSSKNDNDVMTAIKRPKKAAIEFIKQFARAYQYNAELPRGLESMIVNWDNAAPLPKEMEAFLHDTMVGKASLL